MDGRTSSSLLVGVVVLDDSTLRTGPDHQRHIQSAVRAWQITNSSSTCLLCYLFRVGHLPHRRGSGRRKRTRGSHSLLMLLLPPPSHHHHHLPLKFRPNSTWWWWWCPALLRCRCSPSRLPLSGPASALADRSCTGTRKSRRVSFGIAEPPEGFAIRRRIENEELFICHPGELNLNGIVRLMAVSSQLMVIVTE